MKQSGEIIFADESAITTWNPKTKKHYESKGYNFTFFGDEFEVKVIDLPSGSNIKIRVECPKCHEIRFAEINHLTDVGNSQCHRCSRVNNRLGQKFGRLTPFEISGKTSNGDYIWNCMCDCGNIKQIVNTVLGKSVFSCGCLRSELVTIRSKERCGPKHRNWNPALTDEERRAKRDTLEDSRFRYEVYRRDKFKCVKCSSNESIVAHHLNSYSRYPELRYSIDNGVTLCKICHLQFHSIYGYKKFSEIDFEKWVGDI